MTEKAKQKRRDNDREYRRMRRIKNIDKPIKKLSHREQSAKRKHWRSYARAYRERIAAAKEAETAAVTVNTPMDAPSSVAMYRTSSSRKASGRRQVRRRQSIVVRELKRKTEELERKEEVKKFKAVIERDRKRMQRMKNIKATPSLATKVRRMTAKRKITPEIKKRLLFGEVLASSLQQKKKQCGKKGSQTVASIAASALFRKYNLIGSDQGIFGYKMFSQVVGSHHFQHTRKQMVRGGRIKEAKQVQNFLEEDQNSQMCPGKKDHKKKTQKRHLLYTMKELHEKYKDRFKSTISYIPSLTTLLDHTAMCNRS